MKHVRLFALLVAAACFATALPLQAQSDYGYGSRNLQPVGLLLVDGGTGSLAIEQDAERPFAYLARRQAAGTVAVDLSDPADPRAIPGHESAQVSVHDLTLFAHLGRQYLVLATDLGADVVDVTDPSNSADVAHVFLEGGFRDLFAYKHSDGRSLLFATGGGAAFVYDLVRILGSDDALIAAIDTPQQVESSSTGFDDLFVGYEPDTAQDRLYGAGAGGYFVFDVTEPTDPELLVTVSSAAVERGRAIAPTPDGRFALTAAEYRTAPIRVFDVSGSMPRVRTAVGAWTADWRSEYTDIQMRWPFAFVAALEGGLHVVNLFDPVAPYTDAYYMPYFDGPVGLDIDPQGISSLDIRNHDGLVVASDLDRGFLVFRLEAFERWHGHAWGQPHVSRAQDWVAGPDGR